MAGTVMTWLIAIPLLGFATGLRSMTAMAVVCWFAHLALLPVEATWARWAASTISVGVFSLLALGEYVADKLPRTPRRTAPAGFITRCGFGAVVGAIVATGLQGSLLEGVVLGLIGATIGTFSGFHARRGIVEALHCRDWPIALFEDFAAILITVFALRIATA